MPAFKVTKGLRISFQVLIPTAFLLASSPAVNAVAVDPGTSLQASTSAARPPDRAGYFKTRAVGSWRDLPSGRRCAERVHRSAWEPRPDNAVPNSVKPKARRVHEAFAARPVAIDKAYPRRWDTWLLQRVSGRFTGTTDEILQWAACKWGLSDNVMRAVAVRESTWFQYDVYPDGRCVEHYSCGDVVEGPTFDTTSFCRELARFGRDYQTDYGPGTCPRTFGITGVMAWQDPAWGALPGNQNGTFPFSRESTAFAADYLASQLRGCYEGWQWWLSNTGTRDYGSGRLWGCVGAWYAGEWRTEEALAYIDRVRGELRSRTWLAPKWADLRPPCHTAYGCPGGIRPE
jgi:hypothetical protein